MSQMNIEKRGRGCTINEHPPRYDDEVYHSGGSCYSMYSSEVQHVLNTTFCSDSRFSPHVNNNDTGDEYTDVNPTVCKKLDLKFESVDGCPTLTRASAKRFYENVFCKDKNSQEMLDNSFNDKNEKRQDLTSEFTSHRHNYMNMNSSGNTFRQSRNSDTSESFLDAPFLDVKSLNLKHSLYINDSMLSPKILNSHNNRRASCDGVLSSHLSNAKIKGLHSTNQNTSFNTHHGNEVNGLKLAIPTRLQQSDNLDIRKTWSPPVSHFGNPKMGLGGNIRTYRSNDQLNLVSHRSNNPSSRVNASFDAVTEEYICNNEAPPKIIDQLNKNTTNGIIRPIAFKPTPRSAFVSPPMGPPSPDRKYSLCDDRHNNNVTDITRNSSHGESRSISFSSSFNNMRTTEHLEGLNVSQVSNHSHQSDGFVGTPSPSDSGVGELEAMVRERDAEINTLRNVMDKNERAIFQVYEEKKMAWTAEMNDLKQDFERKIKIQQRKAYKMEQQLMLQIYKLQQEHKVLQDDYQKVELERDKAISQVHGLESKMFKRKTEIDESEIEQIRRADELSEMQLKLKESCEDLSVKSSQNANLKSDLQNCQVELDLVRVELAETKNQLIKREKSNESVDSCIQDYNTLFHCNSASSINISDVSYQLGSLNGLEKSTSQSSSSHGNATPDYDDIDVLRDEITKLKHQFNIEKDVWLEEKTKVIRYQKQLQLNYVQMFRKNKSLEADVEQLTLELESRDMKLLALNTEESAC